MCHRFSYISFIFLSILFIGCDKGSEDPVYDKCLVTRMYVQGDTSQTSTHFTYDASNRLIYWDGPGPVDNSISYGDHTITIRGVGTNSNSYSIYYIGPDSMATSSAQYIQGSRLDTMVYTYDANKYLTKAVRYTDAFGKDSTLLNYSGGNLSGLTIYNSNGTVVSASLQYGSQPAKSWVYQMIGPYANNGAYLPWLGRANKNLISSYSSEFNGNPDPVSVNYDINASGYVDSYASSYMSTNWTTYLEYKCE